MPNHTAAAGQIKQYAGPVHRFTGRWGDDKAPEDATTTGELVSLYHTARRPPHPSPLTHPTLRDAEDDRPRAGAVPRACEAWLLRRQSAHNVILEAGSSRQAWVLLLCGGATTRV